MTNRVLTADELKIIKYQQDNSPVVRYLRSKENFRFSVGDFLIRKHKRGDKWEVETISHVSEQPKRYVCIHEDEYGIKYVKSLSSFGEELPVITILSEVNDWTRYEVDPEYAEHIILDGDNKFDFSGKRKEAKARRDAITKKNKKLALKFKSLLELDNALQTLVPGQQVWIGKTVPEAASSEPVIVTKIALEQADRWRHGTTRDKTWILHVQGKYGPENHSAEHLFHKIVITAEPFSYETI